MPFPALSGLFGGSGTPGFNQSSGAGPATGYATGSSSTGAALNLIPNLNLNAGSGGILIFVALLIFGIGVFLRR